MLLRNEWNCAVELRHLRYFLAVGEALKRPASAVLEKRARAYGDEVTFESECEILLRIGGDHDRAAQYA